MDIFLSRLSSQTTLSQLETTVLSIISKKFRLPFTDSPKLSSCKMMEIQDEHGGTEYHGRCSIKPDNVANWFIKNCRSKKIHNKPLLAHQYIIRNSSWQPSYASDADHRRPSLKVRYVTRSSPSFITEGMDRFKREY